MLEKNEGDTAWADACLEAMEAVEKEMGLYELLKISGLDVELAAIQKAQEGVEIKVVVESEQPRKSIFARLKDNA